MSYIPWPSRILEQEGKGARKAWAGSKNVRHHSLSAGQRWQLGLHLEFGDLEQTCPWVRGRPGAHRKGRREGQLWRKDRRKGTWAGS